MTISGHVLYTAQPTPPTHLPHTYIHVHKWFAYMLVMTLIKEKLQPKHSPEIILKYFFDKRFTA